MHIYRFISLPVIYEIVSSPYTLMNSMIINNKNTFSGRNIINPTYSRMLTGDSCKIIIVDIKLPSNLVRKSLSETSMIRKLGPKLITVNL